MNAWSGPVDYKNYFKWVLKNTVKWAFFYLLLQILYECNLVEFFSLASIIALFSMSALGIIYKVQKLKKKMKNCCASKNGS